MVKQVGDKCIFEASWSDTVEGAVHKYPNDHASNMASVDVLERYIDEDGNLVSKKMLRTKFTPNPVMKGIMPVLGMPLRSHQTTLELNKLDVGRRHFQLKSLNKTYFNCLRCFEVLEYTPDSENPAQTELNQYALIDMYANQRSIAIRWAINKGESLFAQQYLTNSKNNRQGLRDVIQNLQLEWQSLTKDVAKDLISKTTELGQEVFDKSVEIVDKTNEISVEIVDKTVEVGMEAVDKTVEVGNFAIDEGSKMVKSVENVLHHDETASR